jgi:hypothetical protein
MRQYGDMNHSLRPLQRPALLALCLFLSGIASARAGEMCAAQADLDALSTRMVQTDLMVAALECDASSHYNAFVRKFQRELVDGSRRMNQFFARVYGADGAKRSNDFVTRTANESSERSLKRVDQFCAAALEAFNKSAAIDHKEFPSLIRNHPAAKVSGIQECPAQPAKTKKVGT